MYARMRRAGQRLVGQPTHGDTPNEFAAHLRAALQTVAQGVPGHKPIEKYLAYANDEIVHLTQLYTHAAYSDRPATNDGRHAALQAWRKLRNRLWLANSLQRGKPK